MNQTSSPPAGYTPPQPASLVQETETVPVLLKQNEAAALLGVSAKWLERDRWVGPSIPFVKFGRSIRYRASDIAAFIEANLQGAA